MALLLADEARDAALAVLREVYGYDGFRGGQADVIAAVLAGRDCIGVMPTGAGKSVTFQIPARVLGGVTLVVSPLISLMEDQVANLGRRGFAATLVNSTLEPDERSRRERDIVDGRYELVYAAPEGLEGRLADVLRRTDVRLVAVDEAHCISEWGHEFRPSYRRLGELRPLFPDAPVLALTASATPAVVTDIRRQLALADPFVHRGSFFRPNLHLGCREKDGRTRVRGVLDEVLARHEGACGVVYCLSRRSADVLAAHLGRSGVRAAAYHAGLGAEERSAIQSAFTAGEVEVVVATIAFGMGIDKPDVRFVVHRDLPGGVESYYQEVGRAGRDGLPSECVMLYGPEDVRMRDAMVREAAVAHRRASRARVRRLYALARSRSCRHRAVSAYFGERLPRCGDACDVCAPAPRGRRRAGVRLLE